MYARNPNHNIPNLMRHSFMTSPPTVFSAAGGSLTEDQRAALSALYGELQAQFPSSSACRRIPLDFKVESLRSSY